MKFYENGQIFAYNTETDEFEHVGRHTVDLEGLLPLTDELGTYASFADKQLPKEVILFADAEKNFHYILKRCARFDQYHNIPGFFRNLFGPTVGQHLYEKFNSALINRDILDFMRGLDNENSQIFIKALVRL